MFVGNRSAIPRCLVTGHRLILQFKTVINFERNIDPCSLWGHWDFSLT